MRSLRLLSAALLLVGLVSVSAVRPRATRMTSGLIAVGHGPSAIAVDDQTGHAFVTNYLDDTVTMFDTATGIVLHTVAVGPEPTTVVVDARAHRAFVVNQRDDSVSMLDTLTGVVLHTLSFPRITALAVDDQTGHVFVTVNSNLTASGAVAMLDARSGTLLFRAPLGGPRAWLVQSITIDAHRQEGWIANCADGTVNIFATTTGHVVHTLALGGCPTGVAVDARSGRTFMTTGDDATLSIRAARSGTLVRRVRVGASPGAVLVDAHTGRVFAANVEDGTVSVIDGRTGTVRGTMTLGAGGGPAVWCASAGSAGGRQGPCTAVVALTMDTRRGRVFALMQSGPGFHTAATDGRVSVLDAASGQVRRVVTVGLNPSAMAVDEATNHLFIVNQAPGSAPPGIAALNAENVWGWAPPWLRRWLPWSHQPALSSPNGSVTVLDLSRL